VAVGLVEAGQRPVLLAAPELKGRDLAARIGSLTLAPERPRLLDGIALAFRELQGWKERHGPDSAAHTAVVVLAEDATDWPDAYRLAELRTRSSQLEIPVHAVSVSPSRETISLARLAAELRGRFYPEPTRSNLWRLAAVGLAWGWAPTEWILTSRVPHGEDGKVHAMSVSASADNERAEAVFSYRAWTSIRPTDSALEAVRQRKRRQSRYSGLGLGAIVGWVIAAVLCDFLLYGLGVSRTRRILIQLCGAAGGAVLFAVVLSWVGGPG
jgi:hypothetical protein